MLTRYLVPLNRTDTIWVGSVLENFLWIRRSWIRQGRGWAQAKKDPVSDHARKVLRLFSGKSKIKIPFTHHPKEDVVWFG